MPLFKYPTIRRFRRRPAEYISVDPKDLAPNLITNDLNRLISTVKDSSTRNVRFHMLLFHFGS